MTYILSIYVAKGDALEQTAYMLADVCWQRWLYDHMDDTTVLYAKNYL